MGFINMYLTLEDMLWILSLLHYKLVSEIGWFYAILNYLESKYLKWDISKIHFLNLDTFL